MQATSKNCNHLEYDCCGILQNCVPYWAEVLALAVLLHQECIPVLHHSKAFLPNGVELTCVLEISAENSRDVLAVS